jgi:hypothetical protein
MRRSLLHVLPNGLHLGVHYKTLSNAVVALNSRRRRCDNDVSPSNVS